MDRGERDRRTNVKRILSIGVVLALFNSPGADAWTPKIAASNPAVNSQLMLNFGYSIASQGSTVHMVWTQISSPTLDPRENVGTLYYAYSTNGGASFSAPVMIEQQGYVGFPKIAASGTGSGIYIAYHYRQSGTDVRQIYVRRWTPNTGWQRSQLTNYTSEATAVAPAVATWGNAVYVVWQQDSAACPTCPVAPEIVLSKSLSSGDPGTWSAAAYVSPPDGCPSWTPAISALGSTVHVAWTDERYRNSVNTVDCSGWNVPGTQGREELYYRRSTSWGDGFDGADGVRLTYDPTTPVSTWAPSIAAAANGEIHVAYFDQTGGSFQIYHKVGTGGGTDWSTPAELVNQYGSSAPINAARPVLAVSSNTIHMIWYGAYPASVDVFYSKKALTGGAWSTPENLTNNPSSHISTEPSIAVDANDNACVNWYEKSGVNGNGVVYFQKSQ